MGIRSPIMMFPIKSKERLKLFFDLMTTTNWWHVFIGYKLFNGIICFIITCDAGLNDELRKFGGNYGSFGWNYDNVKRITKVKRENWDDIELTECDIAQVMKFCEIEK